MVIFSMSSCHLVPPLQHVDTTIHKRSHVAYMEACTDQHGKESE